MHIGKRGVEEQWFYLFQMVLAGFIIAGLIIYTNDIVKNTLLEKNYLARDVALLLDTVYASPGDLSYVYVVGDYDFEFSVKEGFVRVKDPGGKAVTYRVMMNNNLKTEEWSFKKPYALEFIKTGNKVNVLSFSKDADENAVEEFKSFVAWVNKLEKSKELCKSEFVFDELRMKKDYYIIVNKNGVADLVKVEDGKEKFLHSESIRQGAVARAAGVVDIVFSNYDSYVEEFAIAPAGFISTISQDLVFSNNKILLVGKDNKFVWSLDDESLNQVRACE